MVRRWQRTRPSRRDFIDSSGSRLPTSCPRLAATKDEAMNPAPYTPVDHLRDRAVAFNRRQVLVAAQTAAIADGSRSARRTRSSHSRVPPRRLQGFTTRGRVVRSREFLGLLWISRAATRPSEVADRTRGQRKNSAAVAWRSQVSLAAHEVPSICPSNGGPHPD